MHTNVLPDSLRGGVARLGTAADTQIHTHNVIVHSLSEFMLII